MKSDPELAKKTVTIPHVGPCILTVFGGLHYIRGNSAPYFGLTGSVDKTTGRDRDVMGGCIHDVILKHFPQFADLAALHLSDIDGVPMHDVANGWYHLTGALPYNAGEQYHAGNSPRHFPLPPEKIDPAKSWQTTEYRNPKPDECLVFFAEYVRTDLATATKLRDECAAILSEADREAPADWVDARKNARAHLKTWIDAQRPRWKTEAEACIAKHNLIVYGDADKWPVDVPAVDAEQRAMKDLDAK